MTPRAAILLRQLSVLMAELADELAGEAEVANDVTPAPVPSPKPSKTVRRPPRIVRPAGENDELASAKARSFLRQNNFVRTR